MRRDKQSQDPAEGSRETIDRELRRESDANDFNDTAPYGKAKVRSRQADYDRNRDGLYGGLPDVREEGASGGKAKQPHPANRPNDRETH
ncbi:MAG: DUF2934 domain-containing protein [Proteobacteria bacterium]|nr:DUF2934 domain-containing protein [Pseudomonadota bacterium]